MADDPWRYVGVDRDSGQWIAVGYPGAGPPGAAAFETIGELWDEHGGDADRIVVDVPIGLCGSRDAADDHVAADDRVEDDGCVEADDRVEGAGRVEADGCVETDGERSRRADDLARQVVGPRSSSVFTPPCRAAARAAADGVPYAEVNETNREQTGKGLMRQAANIAPGIVEVEDLLLGRGDPETVLEGHPEVCFRAIAGGVLRHGKRTAPGMDERLAALERTTGYDRGTWRRLAASLGESGSDTGADDLLDALALAVTAAALSGEFHRLPRDPPTDASGLPMQMVYRRPEPFDVE